MVDDSTLSSTMAKTVFERMFETGLPPRQIAESEGPGSDIGHRRRAIGRAGSHSGPTPTRFRTTFRASRRQWAFS